MIDHVFCVDHEAFGEHKEHELKPGGRDIPVTESNKKEYVKLALSVYHNNSSVRCGLIITKCFNIHILVLQSKMKFFKSLFTVYIAVVGSTAQTTTSNFDCCQY